MARYSSRCRRMSDRHSSPAQTLIAVFRLCSKSTKVSAATERSRNSSRVTIAPGAPVDSQDLQGCWPVIFRRHAVLAQLAVFRRQLKRAELYSFPLAFQTSQVGIDCTWSGGPDADEATLSSARQRRFLGLCWPFRISDLACHLAFTHESLSVHCQTCSACSTVTNRRRPGRVSTATGKASNKEKQ